MTEEARHVLARPVSVQITRLPLKQALDVLAAQSGVRMQYIPEVIGAVEVPVTVHAENIPLGVVLDRMLSGTGLRPVVGPNGRIAVVPGQLTPTLPTLQNGAIIGRVIDGRTARGINGASVSLDGALKGVVTGGDGRYRLLNVPAGTHTMTVRYLGYARQTRTVTVGDTQVTTVDVILESSTTALDQVVVTGTIIPTELKAVPNAMTVITAKDLERRGITSIDQLFRGDVPGEIALQTGPGSGAAGGNRFGQVQMFSRGVATLENNGISDGAAALYGGAPAIKTYVDGVELRDPTFLNTIDPHSIERIEIIPGPQASTIYGSGAALGVMQIFTKHGTTVTRPRLTLSAGYGMIQNNYSSSLAPQHDDALTVEGGNGPTTYTIGGSYRNVGQWSPGNLERTLSGFGSLRYNEDPITATASFRSVARTLRSGYIGATGIADGMARGVYTLNTSYFLPSQNDFRTPQQTLGLTLDFRPMGWWTHTLVLGDDQTGAYLFPRGMTYSSPSDTTFTYWRRAGRRTSETYGTALTVPLGDMVKATVIAGADHSHDVFDYGNFDAVNLKGALMDPFVQLTDMWNNGEYVQGQLQLAEMMSVVAGIRAEQNSNFGRTIGVVTTPRFGVSIVQELPSGVTLKLRGAYGRATRPPLYYQLSGNQASDPIYGVFYAVIPNSQLLPEEQWGGEGGLEVYWGRLLNISLTRYKQQVANAIVQVGPVDSVRSVNADANGFYTYASQYENLNLGRIRNDGWELVPSVTLGPWTAKGTWTEARSRIVQVATPGVGSTAAQQQLAQFYLVGSQMQGVPEHFGGGSIGYAQGATVVTLAVSAVGGSMLSTNQSPNFTYFTQGRFRAQMSARATRPAGNTWYTTSQSYVTADLTAGQNVTQSLTVTLQVRNLANRYRNDYSIRFPTQGRITQVGFRWHTL